MVIFGCQSLREEENERHKLRKELKQSEEEKLDALSRRNQEEMQQARDQIKVCVWCVCVCVCVCVCRFWSVVSYVRVHRIEI